MSEEFKSLVEAQGRAFEEFKSKVNAELSGKADAVLADEIKQLNTALGDYSAQIKALEAKSARPAAGADEQAREAEIERKAAFSDFVRRGKLDAKFEVKAMQTGVGADGGFAIPKVIDPVIINRLQDISPVRAVARVVQATSRDFRILVNRRGAASGWVGETAARTETATPAIQEITPPSGDLYANPAVTGWMLEDPMFDVESFITENVNTEWARAEAAAFITGTGTNQPQGFIKGTPVVTADAARAAGVLQYIAGGQAAALPTTLDPYMTMVQALKKGHRVGAVWMMAKSTVDSIRKLKDTTGQFLWQPQVAAGVPETFLGYGVAEAEDMPAVGANAFSVAFGNFMAGYTIVEIGTPVLIRDPYSNKPYTMFYSSKRVGGDLVDSEAIKVLKIATA